MPSEPLALFYAAMGDGCSDCALLQIASATGKVVILVRMQCARAFARRTVQARHGWEGTFERHRIMPVATQLLQQVLTIKAAMFAQLPPGISLVRHRAPYAGSIRYHLGLITPADPKR
ncbi:aspartyl/asparaginyl beta-hydroxylase domain-containing protein [Mycetohabitans sp. B7]|nr:aspartyl/asparaginyl beta-hydroxylase domain-containing protein [Mycetohabitans sp. B7]